MQLGRLVADRFEVLTLAGAGGMGEVFRARDVRTDQEVALKVLRSSVENTGRFVREVHLLAMLHHRGIVRYVDHGSMSAESCYLAME